MIFKNRELRSLTTPVGAIVSSVWGKSQISLATSSTFCTLAR